jgi:hypothetical protein
MLRRAEEGCDELHDEFEMLVLMKYVAAIRILVVLDALERICVCC